MKTQTEPVDLYVLTFAHGDKVIAKVGISNNVRRRVESVQVGCPFAISGVYSGRLRSRRAALAAECAAHSRLSRYRTRGEWFSFPLGLVETLFAAVEESLQESKGGQLERLHLLARVDFRDG